MSAVVVLDQEIDSSRSIRIEQTDSGTFVIAVEDPYVVAIVEVDRELATRISRALKPYDG